MYNSFKDTIFIEDFPLFLMSYRINKLVISYRQTLELIDTKFN
jgi:hypothetical protein